jgi:hypothetical protein
LVVALLILAKSRLNCAVKVTNVPVVGVC